MMPTTITIAGRRYPSVALICPVHDDEPDVSEWDRALGAAPGDPMVYVPAENGVLFAVEPDTAPAASPGNLRLALYTVACYEIDDGANTRMWVPHSVRWQGGALIAGPLSYWWNAEPEWVAETIDRLSQMRFKIPDGPRVRMVSGSYFDEEGVA